MFVSFNALLKCETVWITLCRSQTLLLNLLLWLISVTGMGITRMFFINTIHWYYKIFRQVSTLTLRFRLPVFTTLTSAACKSNPVWLMREELRSHPQCHPPTLTGERNNKILLELVENSKTLNALQRIYKKLFKWLHFWILKTKACKKRVWGKEENISAQKILFNSVLLYFQTACPGK